MSQQLVLLRFVCSGCSKKAVLPRLSQHPPKSCVSKVSPVQLSTKHHLLPSAMPESFQSYF